MIINYYDMLFSFSTAVDCVDQEVTGAKNNHGKRVAYLTYYLGKSMGFDEENLLDLIGCAILHDSALSEYLQEAEDEGIVLYDKYGNPDVERMDLGKHCRMGEKNIHLLPLKTDISGAILYHHENADGTGPMGKRWDEVPLAARIIHIADNLDTQFGLGDIDPIRYKDAARWIRENRKGLYSADVSDAFLDLVDEKVLYEISDENIDIILKEKISQYERDYSNEEMRRIAALFAEIVDYKSEFTMTHSIGIAEKVEIMGRHYGFDEDTAAKLYLAGALHDIGKMFIDSDILEKPDKLTTAEFRHIKNHAWYTYKLMSRVRGFEEITPWSSLHHEKLDGSGYPFEKTSADLGFNERLMGCIDIYQALTEDRPYRKPMTHEEGMAVMDDMVKGGFIDGGIVADINKVFG